jgi:hypothetical protein
MLKIINVKKSAIMPPNLWFIVGANDNPVSLYKKTSPRKNTGNSIAESFLRVL